MLKFVIIFIVGTIETYIFTAWNLAANRHKVIVSSLLMFSYMFLYLKIIDWALKDAHTSLLIFSYALACGVGNYLRVQHEKKAHERS